MIAQSMIAITGLLAIYLTQQEYKPELKKYASFFGLAGQPFWFYTTYVNEQFGIFVLSLGYTYVWYLGFYNNWIKGKIN